MRRHVGHGQFYAVRVGACNVHVRCQFDGFAVQFVKPRVACDVIGEFHDVVVIIVPIHMTQLDYSVRCPNIVIENVAVLLVYARVRAGERRCVLQMWEVHFHTLSYMKK